MSDVCVVTGAGRGLGRLIAERFADKGLAVLCTDIDEAAAKETAANIGGEAWAMAQDVRDPASHRAVAAEAASRGRLAVWVNNAGVLDAGPAWTLEDEMIQRIIDVNFAGVVYGSRAAVDAMRETGGHLINIASISSLVPAPGLAVYGASKHAVLGFTTGLAGDLRHEGVPVTVSAVCPDAMETAMVTQVSHRPEADLLLSAGKNMLTAESTAKAVADLHDRPRLVTVLPWFRGFLTRLTQPMPSLQLRMLELFRPAGRKYRKARGLTSGS